MIEWLRTIKRERRESPLPESTVRVVDHGDFISAEYPDGKTRTLSWKDLIRIEIQTNDSGPFGSDVWWYLFGENEYVCYPLGSTGEDEILEKLLMFTKLERRELIQGMNSVSNQTFVCWRKGGVACSS